jgi:hypothetical protein
MTFETDSEEIPIALQSTLLRPKRTSTILKVTMALIR